MEEQKILGIISLFLILEYDKIIRTSIIKKLIKTWNVAFVVNNSKNQQPKAQHNPRKRKGQPKVREQKADVNVNPKPKWWESEKLIPTSCTLRNPNPKSILERGFI